MHEYVNHPDGTHLSELRRANGAEKPYGDHAVVPGQRAGRAVADRPQDRPGVRPARRRDRPGAALGRARPGAGGLRQLQLRPCRPSARGRPTVLEQAYDAVDYISCHAYYEELDGDLGSFLASAVDMDHFVDSVVATADAVGARLRSKKKRQHLVRRVERLVPVRASRPTAPPDDWPVAPRLIEDDYTVADAVVVGSLLISLLRHSDRVTAACQAQLVNVIAPIRTEPGGPAWRQTIFHPFAHDRPALAKGDVLRVELRLADVRHRAVRRGAGGGRRGHPRPRHRRRDGLRRQPRPAAGGRADRAICARSAPACGSPRRGR